MCHFTLSNKGLALKRYDPVAYFQDGPSKGSSRFVYDFKGVTYWFINEVNRAEFIKKPSKYEPEYGGRCVWAMSDGGGRIEENPESFKIIDGKLYVFYDGFFEDTLKQWSAIAHTS